MILDLSFLVELYDYLSYKIKLPIQLSDPKFALLLSSDKMKELLIFSFHRNKLSKEARNMTSPFYVLSRKIKSTIFEFLETENDYLGKSSKRIYYFS